MLGATRAALCAHLMIRHIETGRAVVHPHCGEGHRRYRSLCCKCIRRLTCCDCGRFAAATLDVYPCVANGFSRVVPVGGALLMNLRCPFQLLCPPLVVGVLWCSARIFPPPHSSGFLASTLHGLRCSMSVLPLLVCAFCISGTLMNPSVAPTFRKPRIPLTGL